MNERIQLLAKQAGFQSYITTHEEDVAMFEKFAELIVGECISRCEGNGEYKNHNSEWGQGLAAGIELCKEVMKQHFGVEE